MTNINMPSSYSPLPAVAASYGGFWVRFLALIIDGIILGVMQGVLAYAILRPDRLGDGATPDTGRILLFEAVSFVLSIVYIVGFWIKAGATPGKMALNLRIVRADSGGPISFGQAIGRYFAYILSYIVLCLGFLWVAFDSRKQGWHDKLAGTVVLRNAPR